MTGAHAGGPTGHGTSSGRRTAEGSHAAPPEHHGVRRPLAWRFGTPAVVVLCGALFVVSAADSGGTDLRAGRYTDLASLVEAEADEYADLEDRLMDLNGEIDRLSEDVRSTSVSRARGRIEELRDPAGLEPRTGPGVSIVMADSPDDVFNDNLETKRYKVTRYAIHQQDLQAVVNALWRAGASAVTIEGQRVVSTTGIKCNGPVVQLQGLPYAQPFEIEAVGDPGVLLGALSEDALVAGIQADAANPLIAIGWESRTEDEVEAPAYEGLLDLQYAEPLG